MKRYFKKIIALGFVVLFGCTNETSRSAAYSRCIDEKLPPRECADAALRLYPTEKDK